MADSLLTRLRKQEKKQKIKVLPSVIDLIKITQALIFPRYTTNREVLVSHKEVLDQWKRQLGEEEYNSFVENLLKERKNTVNFKSSATIERIKQLQKQK